MVNLSRPEFRTPSCWDKRASPPRRSYPSSVRPDPSSWKRVVRPSPWTTLSHRVFSPRRLTRQMKSSLRRYTADHRYLLELAATHLHFSSPVAINLDDLELPCCVRPRAAK